MNGLAIYTIIFATILAFCQTRVENVVITSNENSTKVEPVISVTPTVSATPKPKFDINSKVGIVDVTDEQIICFRTIDANLKEQTPVSIVMSLYEFPQKVLTATIGKKLEKSCVTHDSDIGESQPQENSYYSLILDDKIFDKPQIGIGLGVVKPPKPIQIEKGFAKVDLNNDQKSEFFRLCASNEGLHLTVWTGKPLVGKRIWHRYYYLHYDTEADCRKKDYEGTED